MDARESRPNGALGPAEYCRAHRYLAAFQCRAGPYMTSDHRVAGSSPAGFMTPSWTTYDVNAANDSFEVLHLYCSFDTFVSDFVRIH